MFRMPRSTSIVLIALVGWAAMSAAGFWLDVGMTKGVERPTPHLKVLSSTLPAVEKAPLCDMLSFSGYLHLTPPASSMWVKHPSSWQVGDFHLGENGTQHL